MRPEVLEIAKRLDGDMTPVVLQGPPGSGKTFIARTSAHHSNHPHIDGLFAIYITARREISGSLKQAQHCEIRTPEFAFAQPGSPFGPWKKLSSATAAIEPSKEAEQSGESEPRDLWCLKAQSAVNAGHRTLVIMDDYDLIRNSIPYFAFFDKLKALGVKFLLTSHENIFLLEKDSDERRFLETASTIKTTLPAYKEALDIAKDLWNEEARLTPSFQLDDRGAELILEIAGSYPGLIKELVRLTAEQLRSRRSGQVFDCIRKARREPSFWICIGNMWKILNDEEKVALELLAIGYDSGRGGEVIDLWERRLNSGSGQQWIDLDMHLASLIEDRLLVRRAQKSRGDEEFVIESRALTDFVSDHHATKKLAQRLGIRLRRRLKFSLRLFMNLWLGGLGSYMILTAFGSGGEGRLLVWLPAVGYLIWYTFFLTKRDDNSI